MTEASESLPCALFLSIAGVEIEVRSQAPLSNQYDPPYKPFLSQVAKNDTVVSTRVSVLSTPSPPNGAALLFESGGAWNMRPEASGYRLSFHREGSEEFHTVACSNAGTTEVQVYVDQDVRPSGPAATRQSSPVCYPLDQLLLMNHLAGRGGVVVHSGAAVVDGQALVFLGASGAGKSTLSRLFLQSGLAEVLLSDDRVILRTQPGGVRVWGTPWPGDAGIAANACAPLRVLLFLVKSEANEVVPLSPAAGMKRLMPVASCPWYDPERLPGVLDTCASIVEGYPCYELHFRPDADVVTLLVNQRWGPVS